jgi:hypothetical protein
MSSEKWPSVRFRRIGRTLRELRDETGMQPIRARDLAQILDFYGVRDGPERESLLHLARQGRKKNWPRSLEGRISAAALDFASLESDSALIRTFHPNLVPGLLQIEDYIRAVVSVGPDSKDPRQRGARGLPPKGENTGTPQAYYVNENGRLRTVVKVPGQNALWLATSNADGRGTAGPGGDVIFRIDLA